LNLLKKLKLQLKSKTLNNAFEDDKSKNVFFILLSVVSGVISIFAFAILVPGLNVVLGFISFADFASKIKVPLVREFLSSLNLGNQQILLSILGVFLVKNLFEYLVKVLGFSISAKQRINVLKIVYKRFFLLKQSYADLYTSGKLINLASSESEKLSNYLLNKNIIYSTLIFLVINLIAAFLISFKLTVVFIIFALVIGAVSLFLKRKVSYLGGKTSETKSKLASFLKESLQMMQTIKISGLKKNYIKKLSFNSKVENNDLLKFWKFSNFIPSITEMFGVAAIVSLIYINTFSYFSIDKVMLQVYLIVVYKMIPKLKDLNFKFLQLSFFASGVRSIDEFLLSTEANQELVDGNSIKNFSDGLEIKNLSFSYPNTSKIIKNVSLKINKGEKVAFVGETGSGKSTVLKLILRLYDFDSGNIKVDGQKIESFNLDEYRSLFGYVGQEVNLINGTVAENIKIANLNCSEPEFYKAIAESMCNKFIEKLPDGINTQIGENGVLLSGGQKQRIAIARVLLQKPEIIIFDEATSSLDNITEEKIKQALIKNAKSSDTTFIFVAHRLSSISFVDRIYVLEDGQVSQTGTYKDLSSVKGQFLNLVNAG